MIKRKWFLSAKVAHNNNTGKYSWWNTIITTKSWFVDADELLILCREMTAKAVSLEMSRIVPSDEVEVIALNRI